MNIILFGPPGVGKSTLIGVLKSKGLRAIDLEDVYPHKIRFQLPSLVDGVVFGGADLNPARKYRNTIKVFLNLSQEEYEARRAKRDALVPEKRAQQRHVVNDWLKGASYDVILDASKSPALVANRIRRLFDGKRESRSK